MRVRFAASRNPRPPLTAGERRRGEELRGSPRLHGWLRGRSALKSLLRSFGEDPDTSRLHFPHPRYSLTHSGDWAVAAGTREPVVGIGVDLQFEPGPSPSAARLFLADGEEGDRLRLWTVKEALYKALPQNRESWFTDYRVMDPGALRGEARAFGARFTYVSRAVPSGWLTLAICLEV